MNIIVFFICAVSLVCGDKTGGPLITQNVAEMSDREIIEVLVTSVNRLERECVKQQKRIDALEDTVLKQNEVIRVLQNTPEEREQSKDAASEMDDTPNSGHEESFEETAHHDLNQQRDERQVYLAPNVRSTTRQVSGMPVAFSALASHTMDHLGAKQDIAFDAVNVNTNNVYNHNHGVFTVPVQGIYVITSTILAYNDREVWCDIVVNGAVKAQIYARGTDNRHDQGTQTILLHLKQGDDVSIKNIAVDDAIYGSLYTTFSGFLLYEEEPTAIVG